MESSCSDLWTELDGHSHIGIDLICIVRLATKFLDGTKGRKALSMFMGSKVNKLRSSLYTPAVVAGNLFFGGFAFMQLTSLSNHHVIYISNREYGTRHWPKIFSRLPTVMKSANPIQIFAARLYQNHRCLWYYPFWVSIPALVS